MSYRPKKTEYMFKIVRQGAYARKKNAPFNTRFAYRNDRGWHKPIKGRLIECQNGYHFTRLEHLPMWMRAKCIRYAHRLYLVKVDMDGTLDSNFITNKLVARSFRFVCELETSEEFIGDYLYGNGYAWQANGAISQSPSPQYMLGLTKRWGLSIKGGKIIGEYV